MESSPDLTAIHNSIQHHIDTAGANVAIALRMLDGESWLFRNQHEVYHAASTMKIPVMIEFFRQVHAGKVSLDESIPTVNQFKSMVDGSAYALDMEYDEDQHIAAASTQTLLELCEAMITVSSNLATNLLIAHLGVENIQAVLAAMGADEMRVLRGLEDGKAFDAGLNNTTTAWALLRQLEALGNATVVDSSSCEEMIAIMKRQKWVDGIPAGLPLGVEVANKTGEITQIHHDAGIVYGERPFVLVILTRGIQNRTVSAALIATLTRIVYEALHR